MARSRYASRESHSFYCVRCGNQGIPISRCASLQKEKFHRKKLWCLTCKAEVNHVECKNLTEIEQFKEDFKNGVYENEAKEEESFSSLRCPGIR